MSALSELMSNMKKLMCDVVNQFESFAFSQQQDKFIAMPAPQLLAQTSQKQIQKPNIALDSWIKGIFNLQQTNNTVTLGSTCYIEYLEARRN